MKKLSLRFKYTLFISALFAAAIFLFSVLAIRESARMSVNTFIAEGTPLVEHGSKYLSALTIFAVCWKTRILTPCASR